MGSVIGKNVKISVFGQSHSKAIGVTIDGLPAGISIDMEELKKFMKRRAPGQGAHTTTRKEGDQPEFLSGLVENTTCGAPLCAVIPNTNTRSSDYENLKDVPRPGHADYPAQMKFHGFQDVAGGGHFSGRLTAPVCLAGNICMQALAKRGIQVAAHIYRIGHVQDRPVNPADPIQADLQKVREKAFPVLEDEKGEQMLRAIDQAKKDLDSLGGVIECVITGVPAGIGNPMFEGIENRIAAAAFGIPAVKGIEFGNGFGCVGLRGSQNNDSYEMREVEIVTRTNRHGGILGGISTGMPIVFRVAMKPTSSIAMEQDSVSMRDKVNTKLVVHGRHDPCIVPRAVPCVEAIAALTIYDMILEQ